MARWMIGLGVGLGLVLAGPASAEDWQSTQATRRLVEHMTSLKADAVAVRDPERPERFIAALRVPGQLLVVSATHPAVDLIAERLERGEYRNVYVDLQGTPARDSKFFVHDMEADGLSLEGRGAAFDVVYDGATMLTCDGRWKAAKLDEDEYRDRLSKADVRYARMLRLLADSKVTESTSR